MDGITDFDMKFKRSLIEQLHKINETLEEIRAELKFKNDMDYPNSRRG